MSSDELRRLLAHLVPLLRSMVERLAGHVRDMQVLQHAFLARAPANGGDGQNGPGPEHSGSQAGMLTVRRARAAVWVPHSIRTLTPALPPWVRWGQKLRAVLERVTQERNALLEYAQHLEQAREAGQSRHVAARSGGGVDDTSPSVLTLQELASSVES